MKQRRKKIFVGLSGGVDSSVSAALLKRAGHNVVGVFIKVWQPDFLSCTWQEDRRDAMRVCAHLDIPFLTLDLEDVYKKEVVDYMISEYAKGKTPNPDVVCNRSVKFGSFLSWAKKQGADAIATGHYAQIDYKNSTLFRAFDETKDQTYFLWTLRKEALSHIYFPVGSIKKSKTRNLADKFALPTAHKKDSQGVCFLGKLNMKDFLRHFIETKEGDVLDENGKKIGNHKGALLYTLGERHGFSTHSPVNSTPLYVVKKDIEKNILIVSPDPIGTTLSPVFSGKRITINFTNWINPDLEKNKRYLTQTRHLGEFKEATITVQKDNRAQVLFSDMAPMVSSGQSLVVYSENGECLGGGIID